MTKRPFKWDRRAVFASGAAAALLAATGGIAAPLPRKGGQLRLALSGAHRDDCWLRGDGLFMQVARLGLVFDTLTEIAADGVLRGELATGWHRDAAAREWILDLRPDVLFHDGSQMTAEDVVVSLSRHFSVKKITKHQIAIVLNAPNPNLPFVLAGAHHIIRPAHAPDGGIGTGLYRPTQFSPGQQLIAERVADHFKGDSAGWFDRVELVSVPAEHARLQAIREYLVDGADIADLHVLGRVPDIDVSGGSFAIGTHIGMPPRVGRNRPFDDLRAPERWWQL